MRRKFLIYTILGMCLLTACKSDHTAETVPTTESDVVVQINSTQQPKKNNSTQKAATTTNTVQSQPITQSNTISSATPSAGVARLDEIPTGNIQAHPQEQEIPEEVVCPKVPKSIEDVPEAPKIERQTFEAEEQQPTKSTEESSTETLTEEEDETPSKDFFNQIAIMFDDEYKTEDGLLKIRRSSDYIVEFWVMDDSIPGGLIEGTFDFSERNIRLQLTESRFSSTIDESTHTNSSTINITLDQSIQLAQKILDATKADDYMQATTLYWDFSKMIDTQTFNLSK